MQVSDIYLSLVDIYIFLGAWISTTFNIEVHLAWILIMIYQRSRHSGLTEIWSWALLFTFERFGIENVCILLNTIPWAVEHSVELALYTMILKHLKKQTAFTEVMRTRSQTRPLCSTVGLHKMLIGIYIIFVYSSIWTIFLLSQVEKLGCGRTFLVCLVDGCFNALSKFRKRAFL